MRSILVVTLSVFLCCGAVSLVTPDAAAQGKSGGKKKQKDKFSGKKSSDKMKHDLKKGKPIKLEKADKKADKKAGKKPKKDNKGNAWGHDHQAKEAHKHGMRLAKIRRLEMLAREKGNDKLLEKCSKMRELEGRRHGRAVAKGEGVGRDSGSASGSSYREGGN